MAREYGKQFGSSYNHPGLRALPEDARNLFRYLCTSRHSNAAGAYTVPLEYVSHDLQWGMERVSEGFRNLFIKPFAIYDEANQLVFIPGWWNQNPIENKNVAVHVVGLINALPPCAVKSHAVNGLARYAASLPDKIKGGQPNETKRTLMQEFGNHSETIPKPFQTIEPEPEPEPQQSPPSEDATASRQDVQIPEAPLKEKLFGECLAWLMAKASLSRPKAASLIGKWISEHGETNTLDAFGVAGKQSPPDPVPYITRILKPKAGHAKPTARDVANAHLAGLANLEGFGAMGTAEPIASHESRVIDGNHRALGKPETGDGTGVRARDDEADPIRGGVRDQLPGSGNGPGDLPRTTPVSAERSSGPRDEPSPRNVGMGEPDAIPGGPDDTGRRRNGQPMDVADQSESSALEGGPDGRTEERNPSGKMGPTSPGDSQGRGIQKDAYDPVRDMPEGLRVVDFTKPQFPEKPNLTMAG